MPITQAFKPPFAPGDVDTLQMDFEPTLGVAEAISSASVAATGGFTFGSAQIGIVAGDGTFSANASGKVVQVMATAGAASGSYLVTFTITTSAGRTLHRTARCDIAARS